MSQAKSSPRKPAVTSPRLRPRFATGYICLSVGITLTMLGAMGSAKLLPADIPDPGFMPSEPERSVDHLADAVERLNRRQQPQRFDRFIHPKVMASADPCLADDEAEPGEWFDWQILDRADPPGTIDPEDHAGSNFGFSVAVDGDLMAVAANRETITIEDDDTDGEITNTEAGRVYVFRFDQDEGDWRLITELEPPEQCLLDGIIRFGTSVAVSASEEHDLIAVGASLIPTESVEGAVYVFRRTSGKWPNVSEETWELEGLPIPDDDDDDNGDGPDLTPCQQQPRLIGSLPTLQFGAAVDIAPFVSEEDGTVTGGDVIVVGAPWSIISAGECAQFHTGATYIFRYDHEEGVWNEEQVLAGACTPQELFGWSVSIHRSHDAEMDQDDGEEDDLRRPYRIAVGALYGPAEVDDGFIVGGTVHVFTLYEFPDPKDEEVLVREWKPEALLHAPCPQSGVEFGHAVDSLGDPFRGDRIVVGAPYQNPFEDPGDECSAPGGFEDEFTGAAYVFHRLPGGQEWFLEEMLTAEVPQFIGEFGLSVAITPSTIIVGSPREDIEPDGNEEGTPDVGAAYLFGFTGEDWGEFPIRELAGFGPASDSAGSQFGFSVSMRNDSAVVGAWAEPTLDNQGEVEFMQVGAAYAFGRCLDCPGEGSCFVANDTPGCLDPDCCNAVCQFDTFCCTAEWDEQCVEIAESLPLECASIFDNCPGTGSCCELSDSPGCNDDACCQTVCAEDVFCCEVQWDSCCAALAGQLCGGLCPDTAPSCEGFCGFEDSDGCPNTCSCAPDCFDADTPDCCPDICLACRDEPDFDGLCPNPPNCPAAGSCCDDDGSPGCNDELCCLTVCDIEPDCCEVEWDACCVQLAADVCGGTCPGVGPPSCEGNCEDDDVDGCGICSCAADCGEDDNLPCCEDVCEHCDDLFGFEWCPPDPPMNCPSPGSCCETGSPGCDDEDCCRAVCEEDSFCCELEWDECCVQLAAELCVETCPEVDEPSCEGFCGVPDADGCGTCSCAPDCFAQDNCCEDVCEHCADDPAFDGLCPDDLPESRPSPRPTPPSPPAGAAAPRPSSAPARIERSNHASDVSRTAPNRR